jgi:hypothetical protein
VTAEFKNYLKKSVNPVFAVPALIHFTKALYWKLLRSIMAGTSTSSMNGEIQNLRSGILSSGSKLLHIPEPQFDKAYNIKLVIGNMQIQSSKDWHQRFQDAEMNVSIDRWGWLITGALNRNLPFNVEEGSLLIRSWSSQFINDEELAKDAYSTGERISNAVLFFKLQEVVIPNDINDIIKKLAYQVARNIEYLPNGLTGNHAFNNARALYFAGHPDNSSMFCRMATAVARERLSVLVTNDGFMREGSSHYHFLFTRWVLEMVSLARIAEDEAALKLFTPYAEKLLKACWFFLVQNKEDYSWNIPLVGDVSPDCIPNWLIALPWSRLACSIFRPVFLPTAPIEAGWSMLYGGLEGHDKMGVLSEFNFSSECGWHRIEGFNWTIITYAPNKYGMEANHSHRDLCSFVAYCNGKPMIVDIGRLDYTNSPTSRFGKSARSHNTIIIDEIEPTADVFGWMLPAYAKLLVNLQVKRDQKYVKILIDHNGFKRITKNAISHQRELIISTDSLEIIDNINGNGVHNVYRSMQFAPGISFQEVSSKEWRDTNNSIIFNIDGSSSVQCFVADDASEHGWVFPSYGVKEPALSVTIDNLVSLPAQLRNKITIGLF